MNEFNFSVLHSFSTINACKCLNNKYKQEYLSKEIKGI